MVLYLLMCPTIDKILLTVLFLCYEKVFAITLDNAPSNVSAMRLLRPLLSKYLGIEVVNDLNESDNTSSNIFVVNSMFLYQRCACYIINLILKEALEYLSL